MACRLGGKGTSGASGPSVGEHRNPSSVAALATSVSVTPGGMDNDHVKASTAATVDTTALTPTTVVDMPTAGAADRCAGCDLRPIRKGEGQP